MRSTIQLRTGSPLCDMPSGPNEAAPFVSTWVGIQKGNSITQIGFDHERDGAGDIKTCRFWATGGGDPQGYNCNQDANDTKIYFKIKVVYVGILNPVYKIEDCGSNGWSESGCSMKDEEEEAYSDPTGDVETEATYPEDPNCGVYFNGSAADKVNFGNSEESIEGMTNDGDSNVWDVRNLDPTETPDACFYSEGGHWHMTANNDTMQTWDDRN